MCVCVGGGWRGSACLGVCVCGGGGGIPVECGAGAVLRNRTVGGVSRFLCHSCTWGRHGSRESSGGDGLCWDVVSLI